jgi:N-acetylneuraminic acid mutarotase
MPFATGAASSAYINGKAIVVGGIVNGTTVNYAASYDPVANRWTWVAPMLHGVNHAASTTDGTRLWVFGGRAGGNTVSNGYNYVQVYTPSTNSWRWSSPLPQARGGMGKAVYYQGEFYIFGGETYNGAGATALHVYDRVDIYNPATNTWRRGTAMPTPRHGIFPLLFWGHIFIAGGGIHSYYSTSTANDVYVP